VVSAPSNFPRSSMSGEQTAMAQQGAWRHEVEVFSRDTIADFLRKLAVASGQLAKAMGGTGQPAGSSPAQVYQDQSSNAKPQVLMIYCPAGNPAAMLKPWTFDAYMKQCNQAMSDVNQWQPLDPSFTFEQYAGRFPFCGPPGTLPPLLRLEDAGEGLRMRNHHYRRLMQEQVAASNVEDLDTDRQAFAHGCCLHKDDGNSPEWRPCIARAEGGGKRSYRVSWAFTPSLGMTRARESPEQILDEASVLLAPREAKINAPSTASATYM